MRISENLLTEISNNTFSDNTFSLHGSEIHYEDMLKLVNAIKLNKHIKIFILLEIESIEEGSFTLLASLTNLEEIVVSSCRMTDLDARELLTSKVKVLCLEANNLSDACLEGIEKNKTLTYLSLSVNAFTYKGMKMLSKNNTIKELSLSQCRLDDRCAALLANMRFLEKLDLSTNDITDFGFKILEDSRIREIDLDCNISFTRIKKITREPAFPAFPAFEASKKSKRKEEEDAETEIEVKEELEVEFSSKRFKTKT